MVNGKAIIPNMGHPSREGEQVAVAEHLSSSAEIINMQKALNSMVAMLYSSMTVT